MRIEEHVNKADRIERSGSSKLSRDADYEMFVEWCMLAGTHLLNAVLHHSGITSEDADLLHSDKPWLGRPVPPEIAEMMRKLKEIEDLRDGYLRGKAPWQPAHGDLCIGNMASLRASASRLLSTNEVEP
jgi:hypothetical protein